MYRVALVAVLACACRDADPIAQPMIEVASYAAVPARQLDVLFQMDDNTTVDPSTNLATAIGGLFTELSTLDGGLPDLHIGVITSDLGTSGSVGEPAPTIGSIGQGGCEAHGLDGALQTFGVSVTDRFVVDEDDGGLRRRNYIGDLSTVVGKMLSVGGGGCGFEQPLAATIRSFHNDANVGFSRPNANLLIVILADEDDCSVGDTTVFGPEDAILGPFSSFRCTRFGIQCAEPVDVEGAKTECRPREDSPYIEGISPFVDFVRTVRGDPARVAVAAIVGPPTVSIEQRAFPGGTPQLALAHSCPSEGMAGREAAAPAVRIAAAIDELGPNSTLESICSSDLSPAVANIARAARGLYGVTCLDTARVGTEPACSVTVEDLAGETPLSLCPAAGDCFEIVPDAACGGDLRLVVHLVAPTAGQYVRARCITPAS